MDGLTSGFSVPVMILAVLGGLTVLFFCIKGISSTFGANAKKKHSPVDASDAAARIGAMAANGENAVSAETLAAITAAIASVWEGEHGFVVRRVKRINHAPAWNRAGREEQTYSRF